IHGNQLQYLGFGLLEVALQSFLCGVAPLVEASIKRPFSGRRPHFTSVVIFRRRLHQLIGRNGCCAASS
ncbi:hypothetical protein ACSWZG_007118, partial [Pseudomonas aeruginosa]